MQFIAQFLIGAIKAAVVLAINVSLFLIIPITHDLLGLLKEEKKEAVTQQRVVAEYVKPKQPKKEPEPQTRLRSVSDASSRPMQQQMKFDFSPDLSVEGSAGGVGIESQELQAEVFEEGEVDQDAVPISRPIPKYPERARDLAVEGTVTVTFMVGVDGKVSVQNIDAPHPSFVPEIRGAVEKWKFKPAMNKGVPVKMLMRIPIDFKLDS
jgi:protein TonB